MVKGSVLPPITTEIVNNPFCPRTEEQSELMLIPGCCEPTEASAQS
jgi:hypothetical protein